MAKQDVDPDAHTVDKLSDKIESVDDPEALKEIYEAETEHQDRKGAKEVIQDRLEGLTDSTDGEEANSSVVEIQDRLEELTDSTDSEEVNSSVVEIQKHAREHVPELINQPLDSIIEVDQDDNGWRVIVESIERRSVPDTQDILGRYEVLLDANGQIRSYRRFARYRRDDTTPVE